MEVSQMDDIIKSDKFNAAERNFKSTSSPVKWHKFETTAKDK